MVQFKSARKVMRESQGGDVWGRRKYEVPDEQLSRIDLMKRRVAEDARSRGIINVDLDSASLVVDFEISDEARLRYKALYSQGADRVGELLQRMLDELERNPSVVEFENLRFEEDYGNPVLEAASSDSDENQTGQ